MRSEVILHSQVIGSQNWLSSLLVPSSIFWCASILVLDEADGPFLFMLKDWVDVASA